MKRTGTAKFRLPLMSNMLVANSVKEFSSEVMQPSAETLSHILVPWYHSSSICAQPWHMITNISPSSTSFFHEDTYSASARFTKLKAKLRKPPLCSLHCPQVNTITRGSGGGEVVASAKELLQQCRKNCVGLRNVFGLEVSIC